LSDSVARGGFNSGVKWLIFKAQQKLYALISVTLKGSVFFPVRTLLYGSENLALKDQNEAEIAASEVNFF
jgi:hypothetical protein